MDFISTLDKSSLASDRWFKSQRKSDGNKQQSHGGEYKDQNGKQESPWQTGHSYNITCKWEPFREYILAHWNRVTPTEVDSVGPNRSKLAMLIETKYGIASHLVENYLRNFERTLPLI